MAKGCRNGRRLQSVRRDGRNRDRYTYGSLDHRLRRLLDMGRDDLGRVPAEERR
jgi:hypothetical protein